MNTLNIILLGFLIIIETFQQVFFKLSGQNAKEKNVFLFWAIIMYLVYLVIWFRLLKDIPLGIALPVMGLNYAAVAIVGKLFFKEKICIKRWCGILLIILGLCFVGIGGANFL